MNRQYKRHSTHSVQIPVEHKSNHTKVKIWPSIKKHYVVGEIVAGQTIGNRLEKKGS